jgi:hypothetical protein
VNFIASTNLDDRYYMETEVDTMIDQTRNYLQAQFTLTGGGTITFDGSGYLKWTERFIAIPVDRTQSSAGYIEINMPANGTVITGIGSSGSITVTASGIPLIGWQALYAVHTVGGNNAAITLKVADFEQSNIDLGPNYILIAAKNADHSAVRMGTGHIIPSGNSVVNGVYQYQHTHNSLIATNCDFVLGSTTWVKANGEANVLGSIKAGATAGNSRLMIYSDAGNTNVYVDGTIYGKEGNQEVVYNNDARLTTVACAKATFAAGATTLFKTFTHSLNTTTPVVSITARTPECHAYYEYVDANKIKIWIDDEPYEEIILDVIVMKPVNAITNI